MCGRIYRQVRLVHEQVSLSVSLSLSLSLSLSARAGRVGTQCRRAHAFAG
eukprot:COSAG03_NODE_21934_length_297_cov_1.015152_1_plen_49_part_01